MFIVQPHIMDFEPFTVLSEIYLEDVAVNESSFLFKQLVEKKIDTFPDNSRFIFYNFNVVDNKILEHTVDVLDYIDIPRFFVIIVTNQESTKKYFEGLQDPIKVMVKNGTYVASATKNILPEFNLDSHMCAHPWVGFWSFSDGTVSPCCEYSGRFKKDDGRLFDVKTDSFSDIVSSSEMQNLRAQFRDKKVPAGCKKCIEREKVVGDSRRSMAPYRLKNIYGNINWESDDVQIQFIGGHLGNICNLKCRICSDDFSSKIAQENIKYNINDITASKLSIKNNNWPAQKINFWQELKKGLPVIRSFEMLGGEPFAIKENIDFVNYVVDQGYAEVCEFDFSTNGTIFPSFLNKDNNFYRMSITVSIDNIGSKFELERHGAKWSEVEQNIKRYVELLNQNSTFKVGICVTISILNVLDMPEILAWIKSTNVSHYYFNLLDDPKYFNIKYSTSKARELILERISNQSELRFIREILNDAPLSDGLEFRKQIEIIDNIRSEKFSQTHPDIWDAMSCN